VGAAVNELLIYIIGGLWAATCIALSGSLVVGLYQGLTRISRALQERKGQA
jgi:hypothetical protein